MYTKKSYTKPPASATVASTQEKSAQIIWEPGTLETLRGFPDGPKGNLGHQLRLLQRGERPSDSSPVPGIAGVLELRDEDGRAWYRVICKKSGDKIYVLHCFEKQSNRIEKRDIRTIQTRLASLNRRLKD